MTQPCLSACARASVLFCPSLSFHCGVANFMHACMLSSNDHDACLAVYFCLIGPFFILFSKMASRNGSFSSAPAHITLRTNMSSPEGLALRKRIDIEDKLSQCTSVAKRISSVFSCSSTLYVWISSSSSSSSYISISVCIVCVYPRQYNYGWC